MSQPWIIPKVTCDMLVQASLLISVFCLPVAPAPSQNKAIFLPVFLPSNHTKYFLGEKVLSILPFTYFELNNPLMFLGVRIFGPNRNQVSFSTCISYKTHSTVRAVSSSRESPTAATLSGGLRASLTRLPVRVSV